MAYEISNDPVNNEPWKRVFEKNIINSTQLIMKYFPGATDVIRSIQLVFDEANLVCFRSVAKIVSEEACESLFSENRSAFHSS